MAISTLFLHQVAEYSRRDASLLSKPRTAILYEPDSSGRPPKSSLKILTEGHQYYRQVFKKPKPGDWLTVLPRRFATITDRSDVLMGKVVAIHAVRSSENTFPGIALKVLLHRRLKMRADPTCASNLREYFKLRKSCWLIEETENGEFNCDCPIGFKGKNCKHGLGLGYKKETIEVLPHAEALKLGEKRKRGRPKKINMERPFSASANVEVIDEPAVDEPTLDEVAVAEPIMDEVVLEEPAVEEATVEEVAVEEAMVEEALVEESAEVRLEVPRRSRRVERRKVVSPALKSGVRKTKKKGSKKSPSPISKRKRVSAPPSSNTSPVLKPPQKVTRRRAAGLVERLIE